jgi:hypothetical protein
MLNTKNMVKALAWVDYHTSGPEHVGALLKRSGGDLDKLPEISGVYKGTLLEGIDDER